MERRDLRARDQLVPVVYGQLHRHVAASLRREYRSHTLQPTAGTWLFVEMKGAMGHDA
jgi:hypothetical protein